VRALDCGSGSIEDSGKPGKCEHVTSTATFLIDTTMGDGTVVNFALHDGIVFGNTDGPYSFDKCGGTGGSNCWDGLTQATNNICQWNLNISSHCPPTVAALPPFDSTCIPPPCSCCPTTPSTAECAEACADECCLVSVETCCPPNLVDACAEQCDTESIVCPEWKCEMVCRKRVPPLECAIYNIFNHAPS
jgi:hypothetical protein